MVVLVVGLLGVVVQCLGVVEWKLLHFHVQLPVASFPNAASDGNRQQRSDQQQDHGGDTNHTPHRLQKYVNAYLHIVFVKIIYFRWSAFVRCSFLELRTYVMSETDEGEEKQVDSTLRLSLKDARLLFLYHNDLVSFFK